MAQVVKLKRTSVQGRVPTISNLELGELAINTHDGRIFFEKDNGTLSIQEILTTNSNNSGSFSLQGAISASSLSISGDTTIGGNLTLGGNITIGDETTDSINITAEFSGSLLPDGNEIYDLGSSSKKWNNIWVKDVNSTNINSTTSIKTPFITGSLLRLSENGDGLRMTNIGAFDKDTSNNFLIFSNQDLVFSTNGDTGVALTLDETTKDANFVGAVTASYFVGDGSGLTNLQVSSSISEVATVTSSFDNQSSVSIVHPFDSKNIIVSVYDTNYSQLIPQSVTLTDNDTVDIILSDTGSGHVVLAKGGHIVSGSYTVVETATIDDIFTNQTSYTINHTFETKNVFVSVYGTDDEQIIPALVSTPTTSSVELGFDNPTSGRVIIGKAGHIVSSSFDTYRVDVSGTSTYAVSHSLNEDYPFVQAWNTDTKKQEQPLDVESTSPSSLTVTFSGNFTGKIIVKK